MYTYCVIHASPKLVYLIGQLVFCAVWTVLSQVQYNKHQHVVHIHTDAQKICIDDEFHATLPFPAALMVCCVAGVLCVGDVPQEEVGLLSSRRQLQRARGEEEVGGVGGSGLWEQDHETHSSNSPLTPLHATISYYCFLFVWDSITVI